MPDLYIANTTFQNHDFNFRTPDSAQIKRMPIPKGSQVKIGNYDPPTIDGIIAQHERYGLIKAGDRPKNKAFHGLCFSVGEPVSFAQMKGVADNNIDVLIARGQKNREEAAIGQFQKLQAEGAPIRELEMSVAEETRGDALPSIAEGTLVSSEAQPGLPPQPVASDRGNRRGRR